MDTRSKILSEAQALELRLNCRAVIGHFDPLLAGHVRRMNELAAPGFALVAIVLESPAPLLNLRARAELAAALAIIDFVIPVNGDPEAFLERLAPAATFHEETHDQLRTTRLIEHVQRRYRQQ